MNLSLIQMLVLYLMPQNCVVNVFTCGNLLKAQYNHAKLQTRWIF